MGREVKRVPLDFNYPLNKVWEGYSPTIERIKGIAGIFEKAPYLKECKSSWDICDKCDEIINCCSESAEHCIWYNKENKEEKVLGIIGAMEEEVEILKGKMDINETIEVAGMTFYSGKLHDKNVVLVRSGVGKVNMASCTQILADKFNVTALLNSGVAGTMDPELNQGDIVISTDAVQHDFDTTIFGDPLGEISRLGITFFQADKELVEVAKKAAENIDGLVIKEGRIASGDQFVAGGAVEKELKKTLVMFLL